MARMWGLELPVGLAMLSHRWKDGFLRLERWTLGCVLLEGEGERERERERERVRETKRERERGAETQREGGEGEENERAEPPN